MTQHEQAGLYPPPPDELRKLSFKRMFTFLGPGVIIASVTIGSGELVWASRSGAIFGYTMLWCFLAAGLFKGVQVYAAARHITLTGESPMVTWRSMPGPPGWFPILIALPTLLVMPIAFSGISEILGRYLHNMIGPANEGAKTGTWEFLEFWENVWASAVLSACFLLAVLSTLIVLERVSAAVLGVLVLCIVVSIVLCRPNLWEIVLGLIWPRVPEFEPWVLEKYPKDFSNRSPWLEIALYLSAVGGGTYDYIGYIGMLREKHWGLAGRSVATRQQLEAALNGPEAQGQEQLARARVWTRAPLLDTGISFGVVIFVTLLFAVLGALVLNGHAIPAENLLDEQEEFLTVLHHQLRWVYRLGVLLAFIGTLYGAFEIYQQTVAECVRAIVPSLATERMVRWSRRATLAYCFLGGLAIIWLPMSISGDVVGRMTFSAVIGGALYCGLWCFAMLWADRYRLPSALHMSRPLKLSLWAGGFVMTGLGVQTIIVYFTS